MREGSGCLSVIRGRIAVACRECVYSVCNLKRDGSFLSVTRGRMAVILQLHEARWRLFFSYMRQDGGYRSVTSGRRVVICQQREAQ